MDNKVIEVLDYMGEKLGIAIDWTEANVMPQVTEFLSRYRMYEITSEALGVLICTTIICFVIRLYKTIKKQMSERDGLFYEDDFALAMSMVLGGAVSLASMITSIASMFNIAKWIIIPEMQFFELFTKLLNNAQ